MADEDHLQYYRRLVSPSNVSIDGKLVNHANRIGIKLKTSSIIRQKTAPPGARRSQTPNQTSGRNVRTACGLRSYPESVHYGPTYIQNVVVPLSVNCDEEKRSVSNTSAKTRMPLVQRTPQNSAHSLRSLSTVIDKYTTSAAGDRLSNEENDNKQESWNKSEQAKRFQHEQEHLKKSRQLKRTTQIQSHRLDRMYYMSGTPVKIDHKYSVDNEELERLKDLARVRKRGKYYGKGICDAPGDRYISNYGEGVNVPLEAPLSAHGSQSAIQDDESQQEAFITQQEMDPTRNNESEKVTEEDNEVVPNIDCQGNGDDAKSENNSVEENSAVVQDEKVSDQPKVEVVDNTVEDKNELDNGENNKDQNNTGNDVLKENIEDSLANDA